MIIALHRSRTTTVDMTRSFHQKSRTGFGAIILIDIDYID